MVGPDSGPLALVVSQDPMYVTFPVSQADVLEHRKDGRTDVKSIKVKLRFSDGSTYDQVGEINFVDVTVDRSTDSVTLRATIANPKGLLIDNQLVRVLLESGEPEEKVVIPQAALIADQEGIYVFVVDNGKAAVRRVKVGGESGTGIVIESGLDRRATSSSSRVCKASGPGWRCGRRRSRPAPARADPMISALFVDRPRLAIVIAIVTTIAGLLSLYVIPVAQYPDIVPPQVSVTTLYPGANAAVVDATVAQPIEAQVVGVDKMIYMKSVSGDDGSYTLTVSFELGTDPDINTVNVNNRVQVALSKLPQDVSQAGRHGEEEVVGAARGHRALFAEADPRSRCSFPITPPSTCSIRSRARRASATPSLWGPQDYAMRAWVRTDRLTGLDLTTGDIIAAIQSQNVQAAVGRIGARPIRDDQQLQLNMQTKGRLSTVAEFEKIVIRTNPDGSVLRLGDVARLELGAANLDRATRLNGAPATLIAIYQAPGANAITTLQARQGRLAELQKRFPEDLAWKVTYDPTTFVTATIHEVQKTLIEAFVLVVIVVYLFLGSLRATLIPTLAVPVSLIGTFIVLNAIGYSANTVSLLAVVLAIGIVVDDAIVVVEAVEQVMEEHPELTARGRDQAGDGEITAPIIAITLVLLSVFVPVAFIPGISGELFRQFAVTVAVAMFLSAINALTLSPALCGVLLKPHHGPRRGLIGMVMRAIDYVARRLRRRRRAHRAHLDHRPRAGRRRRGRHLGLARVTPTGFLPEDDQGAFFVVVQLPDGASVGTDHSTWSGRPRRS